MIIEYSIIELNVRSRFRLSHIRLSKYPNVRERTVTCLFFACSRCDAAQVCPSPPYPLLVRPSTAADTLAPRTSVSRSQHSYCHP